MFHDLPIVVTNEAHRFIVQQQLTELGVEATVVLEPYRRESGPAILAGCTVAAREFDDEILLVAASDHVIRDVQAFHSAILEGLPAAGAGRLVTFGVTPSDPNTGYGYIEPGESAEGGAFSVKRFTEKPDAVTATKYVLGGCLWNSGTFLFSAKTLIAEYRRLSPATAATVHKAVDNSAESLGAMILNAAYADAKSQSIDYAVMEKTSLAAVVPLTCGWSDIGSWDALWSLGEQDENENVRSGDVELLDSHGCLVSTDGPLTSLLGVSDLVVVANRDAILVADRRRSGEVKQVVENLRLKGRTEADSHARVARPWGWYQIIDGGSAFQAKRIVVNPGGRLSLQKHRHRAEHWVVVAGRAKITVNDEVRTLAPNEHIAIPLGAVHRLENADEIPVEIIEIQTGTYFGEDDIVRLDDVYERA